MDNNTMTIVGLLLAAVLGIGLYFFLKKQKKEKKIAYNKEYYGTPNGETGEEFIYKKRQEIINTLTTVAKTEMGITVNSNYTLNPKFLRSINDSGKMAHRQCVENGWSNLIDFSKAIVLVFPDVQTPEETIQYGPSFQAFFAPGDPYDGSSSDQDKANPGGFVYAAEQVLNYSPALIIVADYKKNWKGARNATFHGWDHVNHELNGVHTQEERTHQNGQSAHPLAKVSGYEDGYEDDDI